MEAMRKRNLISAAVLIAFGIGYAVLAVQLPTRNIENATGPSFFPVVVVTCFLILAAALLIQAMRGTASLGSVPALPKISLGKYGIALSAAVLAATDLLREYLFDRVYLAEPTVSQAQKGQTIVRALFRHYEAHPETIPGWSLVSDPPSRRAADYVSGMTDPFARRQATDLNLI